MKSKFVPSKEFMSLAISEALKAEGFAHPNPLVGAVIVKKGKVLATGYHHRYGDLHAERDAIKNAREKKLNLKGAEIYVTLEPCCHTGKQPPCTEAVIQSGIKTVIIGSRDPNPLVNGKGVQQLRAAGITVVQDFMKAECDAINRIFFHYIKTKTPYITLKYAMTADGKIACSGGNSKWITGEKARNYVHQTRALHMAVMTGSGTVLEDNPMLNVRIQDGKNHFQPLRIVLDSFLKVPLESKIVSTAKEHPVLFLYADSLDSDKEEKAQALKDFGVELLRIPADSEGHVLLKDAFNALGQKGIDSIFIESGSGFNGSLLFNENLVNELQVYIAPKVTGSLGEDIRSPVRGKGVLEMKDAILFSAPEIMTFDQDVLLKYFFDENKDKEAGKCLQE